MPMRRPSDFYPRPPRGGRRYKQTCFPLPSDNFYPRPPRGGRLDVDRFAVAVLAFLSTPSARRATNNRKNQRQTNQISIHALREEGDRSGINSSYTTSEFLSTPSARRATTGCYILSAVGKISIHALREEGDTAVLTLGRGRGDISIHALREEGDFSSDRMRCYSCYFYPRPPRGGRPY